MGLVKNIFLIGPMGAGKSTIGRQVASLLRMRFTDSDLEIQKRTGVDIPTIFDFEGEEGFRKREKAAIEDLTSGEGQVLATGGGAILDSDNRRLLSSRGVVIYLTCTPQQQFERTSRDKNRPLLQTENPLARLEALMQERDPLYQSIADFIVSTENRSAQTVAKEIVRHLEER